MKSGKYSLGRRLVAMKKLLGPWIGENKDKKRRKNKYDEHQEKKNINHDVKLDENGLALERSIHRCQDVYKNDKAISLVARNGGEDSSGCSNSNNKNDFSRPLMNLSNCEENSATGLEDYKDEDVSEEDDDQSCIKPILRSSYLPILLRLGDSSANRGRKNARNNPRKCPYAGTNTKDFPHVDRCESWCEGGPGRGDLAAAQPSSLSCLNLGKLNLDRRYHQKKSNKNGSSKLLCGRSTVKGLIDDDQPIFPISSLDRAKSTSAVFFSSTLSSSNSSAGAVQSCYDFNSYPGSAPNDTASAKGKTFCLCSSAPKTAIFANDSNRHFLTTLVGVLKKKSTSKSTCSLCPQKVFFFSYKTYSPNNSHYLQ